jgi:hypothetical protein
MNRYCLLFLILFLTAPVFAEPKLRVQMNRAVIHEGETIYYQLTLSDNKPLDESITPDTSAWTDFLVQALPKRSGQRSSSRVVINGKVMQDETHHAAQFSYILTPKRTGSLLLPPPKVFVDGTPLLLQSVTVEDGTAQGQSGGSVPITVSTPEKQDNVVLRIEANRTRLYPLQTLTITLTIWIKALPEQLAEMNPLTLPSNPPRLQIPWIAGDTALPKGLVPVQKFEDWLNSLVVSRPQRGFAINDLGENRFNFGGVDDWFRTPFSQNLDQRKVLYQFSDTPKQVKRKDHLGNETVYWEYRFVRSFTPQEIGDFVFGPVTLKGMFAVADSTAKEGINGKDIYAVAPQIAVRIVDVPQENRPSDYIGAFGTFRWSVDVKPRKAKVGDPMTLTLQLAGQGQTGNVTMPDLTQNPAITEHFRVHQPPTEDADDQSCSFTYTIRPIHAGTVTFPVLTASIFDVEKEKFITLESKAIPLEIGEAETVSSAAVFGNTPDNTGGEWEKSDKGLFANMTDPNGAVDQSVDYVYWLETLIAVVSLYFILAGSVSLWQRRNADPKRIRRRRAKNRANSRLIAVLTGKIPTSPEELQSIFLGYVADMTDSEERGMTTADACRKLGELGTADDVITDVRRFLETLDGAKYGGLDLHSMVELTNDLITVLERIQSKGAS